MKGISINMVIQKSTDYTIELSHVERGTHFYSQESCDLTEFLQCHQR